MGVVELQHAKSCPRFHRRRQCELEMVAEVREREMDRKQTVIGLSDKD
jgi:hypothetical protein